VFPAPLLRESALISTLLIITPILSFANSSTQGIPSKQKTPSAIAPGQSSPTCLSAFDTKKYPRTHLRAYEGIQFQSSVNCSTLNTRSILLERLIGLPAAKVLERCGVVSGSCDALGTCSLGTDDTLLAVCVQGDILLAASFARGLVGGGCSFHPGEISRDFADCIRSIYNDIELKRERLNGKDSCLARR
jgi:hypothetical protein